MGKSKSKICRLQKPKSTKKLEMFQFKFSKLQALQVPKGWDKIFVSIISLESGKTIKRSAKAMVLKGKCRWSDTLSQSLLISRDDAQKDTEDCLNKFVVAMGSVGFGALGEATLNLVNIQCLAPKTGFRDETCRDTSSIMEEMNADYADMENKSDISDNAFIRSARSSSSSCLLNVSHRSGEFYSKEVSSASGSSFGSIKGSFGRGDISNKSNLSGVFKDSAERQDLSGTQDGNSGYHSFNGSTRSNHSSSASKVGSQIENQGEEPNQVSVARISTSHNSGSSQDLLDAAEVTIELLQAEVDMGKQNSQRLMAELDKLRNEILAETKHRTSLQVELSEIQTQFNGLQQELDKLRMLVEGPREKPEAQENILFRMEDKDNIKKEWEREIKFQKELNANLALQLKRSQEANLELVSVLQEMESTMKKQQMEINKLSIDKVEIEDIDTYSISSEDNKRMSSDDQYFPEDIRKERHGSCAEDVQLREELEESGIKALKLQLPELQKKQEEIIPISRKTLKKIHESESEGALRTKGVMGCGVECVGKFVENNREKTYMDTKFSEDFYAQGLEGVGLCFENGENRSPFKEIEVLRKKLQVLEQDHRELREENMELRSKLTKSRMDIQTCQNSASSFLMPDLNAVIKISELFSKLYECFQLSATSERNRIHSPTLMVSSDYKCNFSEWGSCGNEDFHAGEQAEVIFNKFIQLKDLFEASFTFHEDMCKCLGEKPNPGVAALPQAQTKLENGDSYENTLSTGTAGVESLHTEFGFNTHNLEQNVVIDSLRHENMLKDKEIEGLKHCKKELEAQIASIEEEKSQMEANVTGSLGKSSMDPQVLAHNIISRTSSELKNENDELEVHLLELENENICLSERISGLEAVLRHLTDEKESTCLLLQDSQSNVGKLQNRVSELENEIRAQKLDLKEKLQDRHQQCFEALEESQNLKIENKKLQATVGSIMEEHSLLQISNTELRKRKMDLQEHCAILEAEVKDTLELFSGILKEVENLEASFRRMLKEISLKEKSMNGELDALVREIKKHNANLARDDSLLNQMYLEKTAEVDNLKRKVVHLMEQMSATFDEKEREASEAILELCCLREDKAMLEAALQEAQGKLKLCESKVDLIHRESERKVLGVIGELAGSKQNQDILMECHKKVLSSLENVKNSESKLKNLLRRHEFKLKASERDRHNLAEEVSALEIRLQKMEKLQDEVLALKKSLIEAEHQNKCLKASFEMLSEDYEKLKAKSVTYLEEISDMQKVASELGDYKRSKVALEEKVWRLEWELTAKEASYISQSKMKNELARLSRTNSQLKRKIKYLEEEKEECSKRVQVLEEKLKQHKEEKQNHEESINGKLSHDPEFYDTCGSTCDYTQCLKDDAKQIHCFNGSSQVKGLDPLLKTTLGIN